MLTRDKALDAIAANVTRAGGETTLALATVNVDTQWLLSREALTNGLRERGIELRDNDVLKIPEPEFGTSYPDYPLFVPAALAMLATSEAPIDTGKIINYCNLPDHQIPFSRADDLLRDAGLFHIPGVGWWSKPQWIDTRGTLFTAPGGRRKMKTAIRLFNECGWPLHTLAIERFSARRALEDPYNYVFVPASYFNAGAGHHTRPFFRNIGMRFIIPAAEVEKATVPMSPSIASTLLEVTPRDLLLRTDNYGAYGLAYLLGKHGLARVRKSRTVRHGKATATIRMELTPEGRTELQRMAHGVKRDAVEVV